MTEGRGGEGRGGAERNAVCAVVGTTRAGDSMETRLHFRRVHFRGIRPSGDLGLGGRNGSAWEAGPGSGR